MTKIDVVVVDFGSDFVKSSSFSDLGSLTDYLKNTSASTTLRIVLIEHLSRDVIELVGRKISLDPRFFENHLRGVQLFLADCWSGDRTPRVQSRFSDVLSRKFCTINDIRPYPFQGWAPMYKSRLKSSVPQLGNAAQNLYLKKTSVYGSIEHYDGYFSCQCPIYPPCLSRLSN